MSRNGAGIYSLPTGNPVVPNTTISSNWANTTLSDIASALTQSIAADGQTPMTGDLNLNTNNILNGGSASFADPVSTGDLTVDGTATISNKLGVGTTTPTSQIEVVGTGRSPTISLTDAATIIWDTSLGQVATYIFGTNNRTMGTPTNLANGAFYSLAIVQNAGLNLMTWSSAFKWNNGSAPVLSTGAGQIDFFVFRSEGGFLYEQGRSQAVA